MTLRLFIAGLSPHSQRALANLREILRELSLDESCLEIIDVFDQPSRGAEEGVLLTPLLRIESSSGSLSIVGTLEPKEAAVAALRAARV